MPVLEEILKAAHEAGASDVHITVGIPPKMRVHGKLLSMNYARMLPADTLDILLYIMTESQREKFEEKGEYDFSFSIQELGRYRINAYKQRGAVALAIRLVETAIGSSGELGIPETVMKLSQKSGGLVLVTGPAGSGKSTTLAAIVDAINNSREAHIITLEDPIEFLHQHKLSIVNQREIGTDSHSYANALRAALRENPDVILLGRMPDLETIELAIRAAEMGHLVLTAHHSMGAINALNNIMDSFGERQPQIRMRLANIVEAVIFQQLIPTADGSGRAAAFEVLAADREVRSLLREGKMQQIASIMQAKCENGRMRMDDTLRQMYAEGRIDRQTAIRFAQDPYSLDAQM